MRDITFEATKSGGSTNGAAGEFRLSEHAIKRMAQRAINETQIQLALEHGRLIHSRHARFYVIGRKEVQKLRRDGLEVGILEGLQVVVGEKSNAVMTVYKNKNLRKIRPIRRRQRHLH